MAEKNISGLHGNAKNSVGQRFGRLVAIEPTDKRSYGGNIVWRCICDCGNECFVSACNLRSGNTQSCGCLQKELTIKRSITHGKTGTQIYNIWGTMIHRCENPGNKAYKYYGGRGITVSEEFHNFQIWYDCIGPKPGPEYSQDRRDNDGNYERSNIQWATQKEQANNRRTPKPISCGPRKQYWFRTWHKDSMAQYLSNNQHEFARKWNLNSENISACLREKRKQHKGWTFKRI